MARLEIILYILKGFYAKSGTKDLSIEQFQLSHQNQ